MFQNLWKYNVDQVHIMWYLFGLESPAMLSQIWLTNQSLRLFFYYGSFWTTVFLVTVDFQRFFLLTIINLILRFAFWSVQLYVFIVWRAFFFSLFLAKTTRKKIPQQSKHPMKWLPLPVLNNMSTVYSDTDKVLHQIEPSVGNML